MKSLRQKILLIICGVFVALLIGEAFFRISGFIVNASVKTHKGKNNAYKILCIGDSSTYGLGASNIEQFSYPAQLQKLLKEKIPDKKFDVINLGIPGINSSQVLNRFKKNILEHQPDTVIMMVGINDPWNFEESNILKFSNISQARKIYTQIELLINQLKLYQFFKLVLVSGEAAKLKIPDFDNETLGKAVEFYRDDPDRGAAFYYALDSNISELKRIAEDNHVNIIFMKYHNVGWGRPERLLNQIYVSLKVHIVDNESLFRRAAELGLNMRGRDGWHPNDYGYSLIAKNVFNEMVSSNIIKGEPVQVFE